MKRDNVRDWILEYANTLQKTKRTVRNEWVYVKMDFTDGWEVVKILTDSLELKATQIKLCFEKCSVTHLLNKTLKCHWKTITL